MILRNYKIDKKAVAERVVAEITRMCSGSNWPSPKLRVGIAVVDHRSQIAKALNDSRKLILRQTGATTLDYWNNDGLKSRIYFMNEEINISVTITREGSLK